MTAGHGSMLLAAALLGAGLTGCQEPGQPGPMERTGAHIDRMVTGAQRGIANFSQQAGEELDAAGKSVGAGAKQVGSSIHKGLTPDSPPPPPPLPLPPPEPMGAQRVSP